MIYYEINLGITKDWQTSKENLFTSYRDSITEIVNSYATSPDGVLYDITSGQRVGDPLLVNYLGRYITLLATSLADRFFEANSWLNSEVMERAIQIVLTKDNGFPFYETELGSYTVLWDAFGAANRSNTGYPSPLRGSYIAVKAEFYKIWN